VIATARDEAGLVRLRKLGAQALTLDVSQPASVSSLSWLLDGEVIDTALYVAGVFSQGGADAPPTQDEFDQVMHTNVLGAMQAIPQVAPLVEVGRNGQGGSFVFITSDMALIGAVTSSASWTYRVSKAALNMAVASAQHDYPRAIMVAMSPGWVRTDMGGDAAPLSAGDSVSAMRQTIAGINESHKGKFVHHDGRVSNTW
jgi:NAD(P)-dependent dehydrogenase (short-subunit alcohol dehydrogenase family)